MNVRRIQGMTLGVFSAMVGFSFALATSQGEAEHLGAGTGPAPRVVGSGLTFSNPPLLPGQDPNFPSGGLTSSDPNGFDLGDAYFGSSLTRYLTALNGVTPYKFTGSNVPTGLKLELCGQLSGIIPVMAGTFVNFTGTVTDAAKATRLGYFRINTSNQVPGVFRFSHDRLSDARVGQDYITNIETLGGDATVKFSVVAGSVSLGGFALPDLETNGISLFADGTISGRALKAGTLTFTARATQSNGRTARNRQNTASDQALSINIGGITDIQSVLGTFAATLVSSARKPGFDTFSYTAFINSNGLRTSDFVGKPFTIRVGGQTFSTTLDGRGQSRFGGVRVALTAPTGTLRVGVRNADFSALVGSLPDLSKKVIVVEVQIGDTFLGTEPIYFNVRNRNGHARLNYGINRSRQIGGLFQTLFVKGDDSFNGTAFQTQFLISQVPDTQGESFGSPNDAVINIGPGFTQDVPLFNGRNGFGASGGIARVNIQTRRRIGSISTFTLPASQTGIQRAADSSGQAQTFLLGMQVKTNTLTFNGVASRVIFPIRFFHFF